MVYKCPHAAETPCSSGAERSCAGTAGVSLDGEAPEPADDCVMSAAAIEGGLTVLL